MTLRRLGDAFLAANAVVTGDVTLAPGVNLWYGVVVRGDVAPVALGEAVNLQDGVVVHCDHGRPQVVEAGVVVGHAAVLHGTRVGAGTLVGIGARLLAGSDVGAGCVIAAGAVVPPGMVVPPRSLVLGLPGRVARPVTAEEVENTRAICAHYRDLTRRYADGVFPCR
jgi:carbonic anhydrase/acetyltransferase-like protein (isoleucine patch superfamily)